MMRRNTLEKPVRITAVRDTVIREPQNIEKNKLLGILREVFEIMLIRVLPIK